MENYDIIVVGMGPAGVSAALYAHRAGAKVLVIGGESTALSKAEKIDNYYGVKKGTSGAELFNMGVEQLADSGISTENSQVVALEWVGDFAVKTVENSYMAKSVILATGTSRKAPKIEGLKEFEGRGVSYCAVCDGFFYRGKNVAVLGEGEYAAEEAAYLKNLASKVYMLTNGREAAATVDGVEIITKSVTAIKGETTVAQVLLGDDSSVEVSGVFVATGVAGAGDFARKLGAELNGNAIVTDEKCATNIPGLFAAGDTTGGMLQIAKAVYQGAVAGGEAAKFVRGMKG